MKSSIIGRAFAITSLGTPSTSLACEEKSEKARTTLLMLKVLNEKPSSLADKIVSVASAKFSREETEILAKCSLNDEISPLYA